MGPHSQLAPVEVTVSTADEDNARLIQPLRFWDKGIASGDFRGQPEVEIVGLEDVGEDEVDPKDSPAQGSVLSEIYQRVKTAGPTSVTPASVEGEVPPDPTETETETEKNSDPSSPSSSTTHEMMSGSDGPLA